jgi:hypothetical protein
MSSTLKRFLKIELVMILLGAVTGLGLFFVLEYAPLEPWELIDTLPEGPISSLNEHYPYLYVTLSNDVVYACHIRDKTCSQADPASVPAPRVSNPSYFCGDPDSITPPSPGNVVASLSFKDCGIDTTTDVYFIGLDDGRVWMWSRGSEAASRIGNPITFTPIGAFIGAVLGLPLNLIVYLIRRRRRGKVKRS